MGEQPIAGSDKSPGGAPLLAPRQSPARSSPGDGALPLPLTVACCPCTAWESFARAVWREASLWRLSNSGDASELKGLPAGLQGAAKLQKQLNPDRVAIGIDGAQKDGEQVQLSHFCCSGAHPNRSWPWGPKSFTRVCTALKGKPERRCGARETMTAPLARRGAALSDQKFSGSFKETLSSGRAAVAAFSGRGPFWQFLLRRQTSAAVTAKRNVKNHRYAVASGPRGYLRGGPVCGR